MREAGHPLRVSVIIPTHNRAGLLRENVQQLWRQTLPPSLWEIIVVDNASTDETPRAAAELEAQSPCPLLYLRQEADNGPTASRNVGAWKAKGKYLAFVDSDVLLAPNWLERAVELAEDDEALGILGGKLLYASLPAYVNSYGGVMSPIGLGWDANERRPAAELGEPEDFLWVATAAVLVRRCAYERVGGFDDAYYIAFEDSDLGWRLNLAGYRCRCYPELQAYHRVSARLTDRGPLYVYHSAKNRLRSLLKNYGLWRLVRYLPAYLAYAVADILLRSPRGPKLAGLAWNLRALPDTLRRRRCVQRLRKRTDGELDALFTNTWLPPEPVALRLQRHAELHGCGDVETSRATQSS